MFEKEAEEYIKVNNLEWELECHRTSPIGEVEQAFQQGAEFGYNKAFVEADKNLKAVVADFNKANEWHYVKDGDLPKETSLLMSNPLLLATKMKGSDCLTLALGEYNFSTQEFSYQHIVGITDVIAWKEIVLPEESE